MQQALIAVFFLVVLVASSSVAHAQSALEIQSDALERVQEKEAKEALRACFEEEPPEKLTLEIGLNPSGEHLVRQSKPAFSEDVSNCLGAALSQIGLPAVTEEISIFVRLGFEPPQPDPASSSETAQSAESEVSTEPPRRGDGDLAAAKKERRDLDDTRVIYAPTALPRGKGVIDLTAHNIGLWDLEAGLGDNVSIGVKFLLPVFIYEVMPYARGSVQVAEGVWLGATIHGGIAGLMLEEDLVWFAGGILQATFGRDPALFNASLLIQGMGAAGEPDPFLFMLPNIGASFRVARSVKLNFEYHLPLVPEVKSLDEFWGIIGYGVRIFGERIYGDISFFCPIFEGAGELYKMLPIGLPMLSFGFQFHTGAAAEVTSGADASVAARSWVRDIALSR